jgi:hypothetical protein
MRTSKVWKWFAVKSVFRTAVTGRPLATDSAYDPAATVVEERVVLFRARSPREALVRGRREARAYASDCPHRNPYGQRVLCRSLELMDCFELFNPPSSGREIYSRTQFVDQSVSDASVLLALLGPARESAADRRRRRNILDIVFQRPAPGIARTPSEEAFVRRALRRRS